MSSLGSTFILFAWSTGIPLMRWPGSLPGSRGPVNGAVGGSLGPLFFSGPVLVTRVSVGSELGPEVREGLPTWLMEDDVAYYVAKFEKTGFTGGLNYYRNMNRNWELTALWSGAKIKVPVKFIVGELDMGYAPLNRREYIHGGGFKEDVPNLEEVIVQKGVAHFNNQEAPEEISNHIYKFIKKF